MNKEEVAREVGIAAPLVLLPKTLFAEIVASDATPAEYARPLLNVVVALLNFEKEADVRQPKIEAEAISHVTLPAEYVIPVEKVVVAELNLEKNAAVRQPNVEAFAVSQVVLPAL